MTAKEYAMEHREYKLPETLRSLMSRHPHTGEKTTQKVLAKHIGIRPQTVSLYLSGETMPSAKTCLAIADYFGISVDYLIIGYMDSGRLADEYKACRRGIHDRLMKLCSELQDTAVRIMEIK